MPRLALQKLPRDAKPGRQRNRCRITGRRTVFIASFGLSRIKLRASSLRGASPVWVKGSW